MKVLESIENRSCDTCTKKAKWFEIKIDIFGKIEWKFMCDSCRLILQGAGK